MPSGNILVADDDAAIRTVLSQALSRAGYEVRSCGNAATLWRWASQGEGDLVITDVVMPDEDAFSLLPRLKKMRPELPVIVMSAQNTFMTAIKASGVSQDTSINPEPSCLMQNISAPLCGPRLGGRRLPPRRWPRWRKAVSWPRAFRAIHAMHACGGDARRTRCRDQGRRPAPDRQQRR